MDGNEDGAKFANLLDQVKRLSELQKSGGLEGIDKEAYLAQLKRKADGIRDILSQLQLQQQLSNTSIPQQPQASNEIYQNLGPLMGSGLLTKNAPSLPPKNSGKQSWYEMPERFGVFSLCNIQVIWVFNGAACLRMSTMHICMFPHTFLSRPGTPSAYCRAPWLSLLNSFSWAQLGLPWATLVGSYRFFWKPSCKCCCFTTAVFPGLLRNYLFFQVNDSELIQYFALCLPFTISKSNNYRNMESRESEWASLLWFSHFFAWPPGKRIWLKF